MFKEGSSINSNRDLTQSSHGSVAALAPRSDWSQMDSEHFVQFYDTDAFLLNSLTGFIGTGLSAGEAGIVVATEPHRQGLDNLLHDYGLDVAGARARSQYVTLDAQETLSKFMVEGSPEPELFAEVIGPLLKQAAKGRDRVRVFGEMVHLLWADGNPDAAIRLEELWNDLRVTHPFTLFCAYPLNGFSGAAFANPLSNVCSRHSRVIPAESYTGLSDADDRLRAIILLQQKARTLEAEIAERREAENALRTVKEELEHRLEEREQLLIREQLARAEAESVNRMKDEFLATVSHELRTPLNAIIGWSHMIQSGGLDKPGVARAQETIERNARAQAQLIEDILDVSRVITGKLRLNIGLVDVASVINAAVDSVQLAADSKDIHLEVVLDPSARHVSGDSGRLQQIVWNLLSNAIKFTPSGGNVNVQLERVDSDLQITVSDTGQGIKADFLPFIFDRFRQADGTSTRRHGGLGLGLAIVRHLVELHGGTVSADSPGDGCGARFTLRLPLAAPERTQSRRRETGALQGTENANAYVQPLPSLDGVRVLLVDDDTDSLNMLAAALMGCQATVETAASASEALELLKWCKPDVLVSDLAMPDEDGYSLIGKVRALEAVSGKHTPAVALTAYVRIEDRTRALSAGFNMFVPKPVEPNELIRAIGNLAEPGLGRS